MVLLTDYKRTLYFRRICTDDVLLVFLFQDSFLLGICTVIDFSHFYWTLYQMRFMLSQSMIIILELLFSGLYYCFLTVLISFLYYFIYYCSMVMYSYYLLWIFPEQIRAAVSISHTSSDLVRQQLVRQVSTVGMVLFDFHIDRLNHSRL